jgi:hypothetical protein
MQGKGYAAALTAAEGLCLPLHTVNGATPVLSYSSAIASAPLPIAHVVVGGNSTMASTTQVANSFSTPLVATLCKSNAPQTGEYLVSYFKSWANAVVKHASKKSRLEKACTYVTLFHCVFCLEQGSQWR